jgi:hypothetical protein
MEFSVLPETFKAKQTVTRPGWKGVKKGPGRETAYSGGTYSIRTWYPSPLTRARNVNNVVFPPL